MAAAGDGDDKPATERALAHVQCGLLTFSDDGLIRFANDLLHTWLGLAPGSLAGRHVDHVLAPASRVFHSTHFFPLLKLHGRADEIHMLLRGASGVDLPVLASAVREIAGDAALNHCTLMSMARRKELEQALLEARRRAEDATAAKDEFLAVVSHELRTPLSAISGWIRLARSGRLDAALQERALETIERNAAIQAQLIDDLLDVSRIVSGKMRVSPRPIELGPVIESAVDTSRPSAQAKGIGLQLALDSEAGIVHADPARIQQIVWNLVANAIKFTPRDGRVEVTLDRAGSRARVQVADNGAGIDRAQLPYLFDRFWQAEGATAAREGLGLGLGLSICKSLVELHGGSIRAESGGLGQGTIFTVEFPLAVAAGHGRSPEAAGAQGERTPEEARLEGIRVVVVDDDADARSMLTMLLTGAGASVRGADSADAAIDEIRRAPPHVVVSDIGMPVKDGYEFIRLLRAESADAVRSIAAIALSGLTRPHERVNMLRAGFQAHLSKPVEPMELIALVAALARRA